MRGDLPLSLSKRGEEKAIFIFNDGRKHSNSPNKKIKGEKKGEVNSFNCIDNTAGVQILGWSTLRGGPASRAHANDARPRAVSTLGQIGSPQTSSLPPPLGPLPRNTAVLVVAVKLRVTTDRDPPPPNSAAYSISDNDIIIWQVLPNLNSNYLCHSYTLPFSYYFFLATFFLFHICPFFPNCSVSLINI